MRPSEGSHARSKEAAGRSPAVRYLRLYDKEKELRVFAVNMNNIKVHEKKTKALAWFADSADGGSASGGHAFRKTPPRPPLLSSPRISQLQPGGSGCFVPGDAPSSTFRAASRGWTSLIRPALIVGYLVSGNAKRQTLGRCVRELEASAAPHPSVEPGGRRRR